MLVGDVAGAKKRRILGSSPSCRQKLERCAGSRRGTKSPNAQIARSDAAVMDGWMNEWKASEIAPSLKSPHVALQSAQQMDAAEIMCACVYVCVCAMPYLNTKHKRSKMEKHKHIEYRSWRVESSCWWPSFSKPLRPWKEDRNDTHRRRSSREAEAVLPA